MISGFLDGGNKSYIRLCPEIPITVEASWLRQIVSRFTSSANRSVTSYAQRMEVNAILEEQTDSFTWKMLNLKLSVLTLLIISLVCFQFL